MGFRPEEKGIKTEVPFAALPQFIRWDSDLKKKGLRPSESNVMRFST